MSLGLSVTLQQPFPVVVETVQVALARQGFGVLTEIDVQATLKAKTGADLQPYVILGACNPPLALRALEADPSIGLLLPCNVVVRQTDDGTVVEAVDPTMMVEGARNPDLKPVADDAAERLRAFIASLSETTLVK